MNATKHLELLATLEVTEAFVVAKAVNSPRPGRFEFKADLADDETAEVLQALFVSMVTVALPSALGGFDYFRLYPKGAPQLEEEGAERTFSLQCGFRRRYDTPRLTEKALAAGTRKVRTTLQATRSPGQSVIIMPWSTGRPFSKTPTQ